MRTTTVYAKLRLTQVSVRQNLSVTGRSFGFTFQNDYLSK